MESLDVREATHAGSWYSSNKSELDKQLNSWLEKAKESITGIGVVKAIIGPHAGYSYSGPTAGWAYRYLKDYAPKDNGSPLRVFLLGPCHHIYLQSCGLTSLKKFATPLGDINVDTETVAELATEGKFSKVKKTDEEEEHSLELHLPYIAKIFEGRAIKLVPIMVGSINTEKEAYYGKLLAKYLDDDNTVFVVSSDFCHWGKRFQYQYYNKSDGDIYQSIEKLDQRGVACIEKHSVDGFADYLEETENTICGRHPIGVLLNAIANSKYKDKIVTQQVLYNQSEAVKSASQSSVSYCSIISYLPA
mmetsp:Transcript_80636/g.94070  ORF Transcript_80636/g.94070 Transcript_80636/m.94070 type:complete len:304 (-) Transcript_80636:138-1049(-)